MTFKQFENIAKKYRPDIIVSQHGGYCANKSGNTLGIVFINKNGMQSRVYKYSGTYAQVLYKLGINSITKEDVWYIEHQIEELEKNHGKTYHSIFGFDDDNGIIDNSIEITEKKQLLYDYLNTDKYVRVWEY